MAAGVLSSVYIYVAVAGYSRTTRTFAVPLFSLGKRFTAVVDLIFRTGPTFSLSLDLSPLRRPTSSQLTNPSVPRIQPPSPLSVVCGSQASRSQDKRPGQHKQEECSRSRIQAEKGRNGSAQARSRGRKKGTDVKLSEH